MERINGVLNAAGAQTFEGVVDRLRAMGGMSRVLSDCAEDEIMRLAENPRASARVSNLRAELLARIPQMRLVVQYALNRLVATGENRGHLVARQGESGARSALGFGYHPEVELAPSDLAWMGYADAIHLTESECEIIDYKTGSPLPTHEEQLRLYALLWSRDQEVNPRGRLASNLTLVYPGAIQTTVAPTASELEALEQEMTGRAQSATALLSSVPPEARVGPETCKYCDVKHLCDDYWSPAGQAAVAQTPQPGIRSVQVLLSEPRGDKATAGNIELDPYLAKGTSVVITGLREPAGLLGSPLRLLDVRVIEEGDGSSAHLTFGAFSEAYVLPDYPTPRD